MKYITTLYLLLQSTLFYAQVPKIEWQKCIGGSKNDIANKVLINNDKSYTLLINSTSKDGDFDSLSGYTNISLFKLSEKGNINKKYTLGEYA